MIGKFIVLEGVFTDRYVALEITGRTDKFLKVVNVAEFAGEVRERRIKISNIKRHLLFDDQDKASEFAKRVTEVLGRQKERHKEERAMTIDAFRFETGLEEKTNV